MKTWQRRTAVALAVVLGLGGSVAVTATAAPPTPPLIAAPATTMDATAAEQITYIRDEERLARDLYLAIAALHPDTTAFSRIAVAEQHHFDSVGTLLTHHGLIDPSAGLEAGVYADARLIQMYDQLLAQAKVSVNEAYKAAVAFEDADIADLETCLTGNLPADARRVMTHLLTASRHHLNAFAGLRDGLSVGPGIDAGMQNGRGPHRADGTPLPSTTQAGTRQGGRGWNEHGVSDSKGTQHHRSGHRADCAANPRNTAAGDGRGRRAVDE